MSTIKKLVSDTAVYGLSSIVGRLINYLLVPLLTRVFTQAEYGANAEFYGYISFLNILLAHGMETAFFRFSQEQKPQQVFANAFISVTGASAFFGLLILLFSRPISIWIGYENHPEFIWYSAGILIFDALSAIPFALLRHQNKALKFAIVKNVNILLNISVTLYLVLAGPYFKEHSNINLPIWKENLGINAVFIANLVASMVTFFLLLKEVRWVSIGFDPTLWRKMISYANPMIWVGLAGMVNETLDRVILKYVWPNLNEAVEMNGVYAANYKLSIIITLFIQAYKYAAEPFFFAHAKQTNKTDLYAQVMNYFAWLCMFIFLLVMLFIDYFKVFIGPEFYEGLNVVPILLWANIFLGMYYNVSIWYKLTDQTKKGAQISIYGAIITIALNLILIPFYGFMGCAITTLVCYFFMLVLGYVWGQKYYPVPYQLRRIFTYAIVSLSLYFLVQTESLQFKTQPWYYFSIRFLFLGIFLFLGFWLERSSLKTLLAKK